jgi:hypothetical protein
MVGMTQKLRHINLPWCCTLIDKMTNLTIVVVGAWNLFCDGGGVIALGMIFLYDGG